MTVTTDETAGGGVVVSVNRAPEYRFSKPPVEAITLIEGLGVDGDVHAGVTVRHRSQMAADPTRPNLLKRVVVRDEAGRVVRPRGHHERGPRRRPGQPRRRHPRCPP